MSKTAFTVALITASAMGAMSLQETKNAMLLSGWDSYDYIFGEFKKAEGGSLNLQNETEGLATGIST